MALPAQLSYCKITARFLQAVVDGDDSDEYPDGIGLEGAKITFTAAVSRIRVSAVPVTVFPQRIQCLTDKDGWLYKPGATLTDGLAAEDDRAVYLVAGDDPDMDPTGWTYSYDIHQRHSVLDRLRGCCDGRDYRLAMDQAAGVKTVGVRRITVTAGK